MENNLPNSQFKVLVLIPLYKTDFSTAEWFSFNRTLEVLKNYPICIACPHHLLKDFQTEAKSWPRKVLFQAFPDKYLGSIAGYNKLLKSFSFYRTFAQYEYLLIAQTDALILSDQLSAWCNKGFSFIGAPFFNGFALPTKPLRFLGVGNGGLSLRRIPDFLRCESPLRYVPNFLAASPKSYLDLKGALKFIKHRLLFCLNRAPLFPQVNEDVYWSLLIPKKFCFFKVAPITEAIEFAFDTEPSFLYDLNKEKLPFACHAWEKYDPDFWKTILKKHGIDLP